MSHRCNSRTDLGEAKVESHVLRSTTQGPMNPWTSRLRLAATEPGLERRVSGVTASTARQCLGPLRLLFLFIPKNSLVLADYKHTHNMMLPPLCIEKPPKSLWLNLCLKFSTLLCGTEIMITTIIEHGMSTCNLSIFFTPEFN